MPATNPRDPKKSSTTAITCCLAAGDPAICPPQPAAPSGLRVTSSSWNADTGDKGGGIKSKSETEGEEKATKHAIDEWFAANEPSSNDEDLPAWDVLMASVARGIPEDVAVEAAAPAHGGRVAEQRACVLPCRKRDAATSDARASEHNAPPQPHTHMRTRTGRAQGLSHVRPRARMRRQSNLIRTVDLL